MSAAIVSYESFKAKREQRPQEYFAYIDLLQEAYPELIKAECEEAVEQWFTQKDVCSERLWADCECINCAIKVPVWESTVTKIKAKFIPAGIVFRAAYLSNRNLMMTFAYELLGEDNDYFYVWHVPAKDIGSNYSYLYSEERLDALRLANKHMEKWVTQQAIASRHSARGSKDEIAFKNLTEDEMLFFEDARDFQAWLETLGSV